MSFPISADPEMRPPSAAEGERQAQEERNKALLELVQKGMPKLQHSHNPYTLRCNRCGAESDWCGSYSAPCTGKEPE